MNTTLAMFVIFTLVFLLGVACGVFLVYAWLIDEKNE